MLVSHDVQLQSLDILGIAEGALGAVHMSNHQPLRISSSSIGEGGEADRLPQSEAMGSLPSVV